MSSTATAEAPAVEQTAAPESPKAGGTPDITKLMPNAVNGMELRVVRVSDIVIPEDRHRRRSRRESGSLGESMQEIGLDTPVSVSPAKDGTLELVGGGGRLEQAIANGWEEIHVLVKMRDARGRAASTAAENMAREDLSPAEEADALELMIKAGDSPQEAAKKVGLSARTGTMRMPLVELPEEVRKAFHHDLLPASLASLVKALYDGNHQVGLEVGALGVKEPERVARLLNGRPGEFFREMPVLHKAAKLRGNPPFIKSFYRGSEHGRTITWHPEDKDRIKLKGKSARWFTELSAKATHRYDRPHILLSEEDLDTAVAIGVAYHSPGEHGFVWVHDRKWLTDHINEFVLPRMQADHEAKAKDTPLEALKSAVKGALSKMTVSQLAPTLERRFKRELQPKAYAANVDFGLALTTKLAVKKLTREQAMFFAYEVLGSEASARSFVRRHDRGARRIAECAARVMADWITVEKRELKSGKIKTTVIYLEGDAAEKKMWQYVKAATSPEEILQRALQMYAAAAFFKRECGANGKEPLNQKPANKDASAALEKIVKPLFPVSFTRLEVEIKEYKPAKHAEEVIAKAKEEDAAAAAATLTDAAEPARATRGKGSAAHAAEALALIEAQPGVTIPELAAKMGVKQNLLYKVLPALEHDRKVTKKGRGWHPVAASSEQPVVLVSQTGGRAAKKALLHPDAAPAGRKVRKVVFLDSKRSAWVAERRITTTEEQAQTAQAA